MQPRDKVVVRASVVSLVGNGILALSKLSVGLLAGSLAVLSDGIDSATDVLISMITLVTAHIASRPPDKRFAYGYQKADTIAAKIVSLVIFLAGCQLLISAIHSIVHPEVRELPGKAALYVTAFSIVGKLLLSWHQHRAGKRSGSSMLIANARNMRNDVIISFGVLLGLFFTFVLNMPIIDSIAALMIGLFVIKSAVSIFLETNIILMDGVSDPTLYAKIFEAVEMVPGANNPHRVRSHQMGTRYMIVLDIEVDGDISLRRAHDIAQAVENSIKQNVEKVYDIVVHIEPTGLIHTKESFGLDRNMIPPGAS